MKKYNFDKNAIEQFYNSVCDDSCGKISNIMQEINSTNKKITDEQNKKFEDVYSQIAINIKIGDNQITIPNTADNIERLYGFLTDCLEDTVEIQD